MNRTYQCPNKDCNYSQTEVTVSPNFVGVPPIGRSWPTNIECMGCGHYMKQVEE